MLEYEYQKMFDVEKTYWWFVGKRVIVKNIIKRFMHRISICRPEILDIGCGTGIIMSYFKDFGNVTGIDCASKAIEFCKQRGLNNLKLTNILEELPFQNDSFDLILCLDVIEHLDNNKKLLTEIRRLIKPEGKVIFTVPALMSLWSVHDEALGHKKRYRKRELTENVKNSGFRILKCTYYNTFLFPVMFSWRAFRRIFPYSKDNVKSDLFFEIPKVLNTIFKHIFCYEKLFLRFMDFPVGGSVLCIAEKITG